MNKRFYLITRDLHLYFGLFVSPFVLVFAVSVFFLVHSWIPGVARGQDVSQVSNVELPAELDKLSGRPLIDALHSVLDRISVQGEVQNVRRLVKEHRLMVPVSVPGRETTVYIDLENRMAEISRHTTGIWDATVMLHKSPGPHLGAIRMNWFVMRIWRWLADATVYLLLFISLSGVYLWAVLRAERRIGLILLAAGTTSFFGIIYALSQ
jgi:hypothetical protein